MKTKKLDGMKNQRGAALILVLIALALGSLLIPSTLNYTYTGLVDSRVSEEQFIDQYTADAAVEYALWQLQNNVGGITDELSYENPDYNTTININGTEIPVNIDITQSPLGEDWPFPVPASQSGIYLDAALDIKSPFTSDDGLTTYFPHVIYMYNSGGSVVKPNSILQRLDPRFTYEEGSYDGFASDLTITYIDGQQELYFDLDTPLPTLAVGQATFVSFLVSVDGEIDDDVYISSGSIGYAAFDAEAGDIFFGEYTPSTIGYYYDIQTNVGIYTILVNVGITEDGEIVIRSYQIQ